MYAPTHEEFIELGFNQENDSEGQITHYWHECTLTYHVTPLNDETEPFWSCGSWYRRVIPRDRKDIETIISIFQ